MKNLLKILTISSIALLASCSKQEQVQSSDTTQATAAMKEGQGMAIVRAVNAKSKTITLAHNNIPGVMDAMTMDYPVADTAMFHTVSVGDSVTFTLQDRGEGNYLVTKLSLLKKG